MDSYNFWTCGQFILFVILGQFNLFLRLSHKSDSDSSCLKCRSVRVTTGQDTASQTHVCNPQVKPSLCRGSASLAFALHRLDVDDGAWLVPGLTIYDKWLYFESFDIYIYIICWQTLTDSSTDIDM